MCVPPFSSTTNASVELKSWGPRDTTIRRYPVKYKRFIFEINKYHDCERGEINETNPYEVFEPKMHINSTSRATLICIY